MAKLAIKGHSTRGNEVIKILEMLGGSNTHNYSAHCDSLCFYIGENTNSIYYDWVRDCYEDGNTLVFTLEEFLEKYPYKVGDKVIYKSEVFPIIGMKWSCSNNTVIYTMKSNYDTIDCYDSTWMKPYKEETMEKEISGAIVDRFICLEGYDFYDDKGNILDTKEITMKKKKPKYPNTYEECCELLFPKSVALGKVLTSGYNCELLKKFGELLVCRDAYWKIAGDWSFKIGSDNQDVVYAITVYGSGIMKDFYRALSSNRVLVFPTEEMRDAFYENFKDLIEECKELL